MEQGQGSVPTVPLPWGAELPPWFQHSLCLSPTQWGCVAVPCLQQEVDREGP